MTLALSSCFGFPSMGLIALFYQMLISSTSLRGAFDNAIVYRPEKLREQRRKAADHDDCQNDKRVLKGGLRETGKRARHPFHPVDALAMVLFMLHTGCAISVVSVLFFVNESLIGRISCALWLSTSATGAAQVQLQFSVLVHIMSKPCSRASVSCVVDCTDVFINAPGAPGTHTVNATFFSNYKVCFAYACICVVLTVPTRCKCSTITPSSSWSVSLQTVPSFLCRGIPW
jgi:hypothetical protein